MSDWVELMTGLIGEVTVVQSWLNANGIPTFVRDAYPYTGNKTLLVPASKLAQARHLLRLLATAPHDGGEEQTTSDEVMGDG